MLQSLDLSIPTAYAFQLSHWDVLTSLKLSCGTVSGILTVTQNLKSIEEFYLTVSDLDDAGLEDSPRTNTLRKLNKLHLICNSYKPKVYRHLFKAIKLPALQDLSLSSQADPPSATVRAFNRSSSCLFGSSYLDLLSSPPKGSSLRTLTISRVLMSEQTLISSLAVCRQIRELSVIVGLHKYPQISSHFPSALTIQSDSGMLLSLQEFNLDFKSSLGSDAKVIKDLVQSMVESRLKRRFNSRRIRVATSRGSDLLNGRVPESDSEEDEVEEEKEAELDEEEELEVEPEANEEKIPVESA